MKTPRWHPWLFIIAVCSLLQVGTSSCSKPTEVYQAIDNRAILTLRGRKEAEISRGGENHVGTFTREGPHIRVVLTLMGNSQAFYFERFDQGVKNGEWGTLYDSKNYSDVMEKVQAQRRQLELDKQLLSYAANGNSPAVADLLSKGANVNFQDKSGVTPLCEAVRKGSLRTVQLLIKAKANVITGNPLLHRFRFGGLPTEADKKILRILIEAGTNIDAIDTNGHGWTALMLAVRSEDSDAVRCLVSSGANRDIKGMGGVTAWSLAGNNNKLVEALKTPKEQEKYEEISRRSRIATRTLTQVNGMSTGGFPTPVRATVSDVSITLEYPKKQESHKVMFEDVCLVRVGWPSETAVCISVGQKNQYYRDGQTHNIAGSIHLSSVEERDRFAVVLDSAITKWQQSFRYVVKYKYTLKEPEGGLISQQKPTFDSGPSRSDSIQPNNMGGSSFPKGTWGKTETKRAGLTFKKQTYKTTITYDGKSSHLTYSVENLDEKRISTSQYNVVASSPDRLVAESWTDNRKHYRRFSLTLNGDSLIVEEHQKQYYQPNATNLAGQWDYHDVLKKQETDPVPEKKTGCLY